MPRISSPDIATVSEIYLIEELKNPVMSAMLASLIDTHHAELRNIAELFNIIPKDTKKNPTYIMDIAVGQNSSHPDQSKLVYLQNFGTPQEKSSSKNQLQVCRQHKN